MLVYTINVSNAGGPSEAENVVLNDVVPVTIIGPEFSVDGGVTFNPWTGSYDIGALPAGGTRTILISGTVSPPTATGVITNTANVTSSTPDPDPGNNTSTVDTEVTPPPSADVSVVKTAGSNLAMLCEMILYTIVVSNAGPSDAENVVLEDNIPTNITGGAEYSIDGGLTFSPWPGTYNIGTLPAELQEL